MPYKNNEKAKEYHRQYMRKYTKKKPLTDEQKERKAKYMREYSQKNKEKIKEISRKSYLKNKDKRASRSKEYRAENAEEIKQKKHLYYLKNKDHFSQKSRNYYDENREKIREYKNRYARTTKGKFFSYQVSAKARNYDFKLSLEEFGELLKMNCHYCGVENARGIDRKDSEIGYELNNSLPCCSTCNYMKGTTGYDEFKLHLKKILKNLSS